MGECTVNSNTTEVKNEEEYFCCCEAPEIDAKIYHKTSPSPTKKRVVFGAITVCGENENDKEDLETMSHKSDKKKKRRQERIDSEDVDSDVYMTCPECPECPLMEEALASTSNENTIDLGDPIDIKPTIFAASGSPQKRLRGVFDIQVGDEVEEDLIQSSNVIASIVNPQPESPKLNFSQYVLNAQHRDEFVTPRKRRKKKEHSQLTNNTLDFGEPPELVESEKKKKKKDKKKKQKTQLEEAPELIMNEESNQDDNADNESKNEGDSTNNNFKKKEKKKKKKKKKQLEDAPELIVNEESNQDDNADIEGKNEGGSTNNKFKKKEKKKKKKTQLEDAPELIANEESNQDVNADIESKNEGDSTNNKFKKKKKKTQLEEAPELIVNEDLIKPKTKEKRKKIKKRQLEEAMQNVADANGCIENGVASRDTLVTRVLPDSQQTVELFGTFQEYESENSEKDSHNSPTARLCQEKELEGEVYESVASANEKKGKSIESDSLETAMVTSKYKNVTHRKAKKLKPTSKVALSLANKNKENLNLVLDISLENHEQDQNTTVYGAESQELFDTAEESDSEAKEEPILALPDLILTFINEPIPDTRYNADQPRFKRWTANENETLKHNWESYLKDHELDNPYELICSNPHAKRKPIQQLKTKTAFYYRLGQNLKRSKKGIVARARIMFNPIRDKKIDDNDMKLLADLDEDAATMKEVAQEFGVTQTRAAVAIRHNQRTHKSKVKGKWVEEEEEKLVNGIRRTTGSLPIDNIPWNLVQEFVPDRSDVQCRSHWIHTLYWVTVHKRKRRKFHSRHLLCLIQKVRESGAKNEDDINWTKIRNGFDGDIPSVWFLKEKWALAKARLARATQDKARHEVQGKPLKQFCIELMKTVHLTRSTKRKTMFDASSPREER